MALFLAFLGAVLIALAEDWLGWRDVIRSVGIICLISAVSHWLAEQEARKEHAKGVEKRAAEDRARDEEAFRLWHAQQEILEAEAREVEVRRRHAELLRGEADADQRAPIEDLLEALEAQPAADPSKADKPRDPSKS